MCIKYTTKKKYKGAINTIDQKEKQAYFLQALCNNPNHWKNDIDNNYKLIKIY